jgi:hypothetical protein
MPRWLRVLWAVAATLVIIAAVVAILAGWSALMP